MGATWTALDDFMVMFVPFFLTMIVGAMLFGRR